mgnify:CR=1 FL=1
MRQRIILDGENLSCKEKNFHERFVAIRLLAQPTKRILELEIKNATAENLHATNLISDKAYNSEYVHLSYDKGFINYSGRFLLSNVEIDRDYKASFTAVSVELVKITILDDEGDEDEPTNTQD